MAQSEFYVWSFVDGIVLLHSLRAIFCFVLGRKEVYGTIMTSFHRAVSARKQLERSFIFKALGYDSIFSSRGNQDDVNTESFRLQ